MIASDHSSLQHSTSSDSAPVRTREPCFSLLPPLPEVLCVCCCCFIAQLRSNAFHSCSCVDGSLVIGASHAFLLSYCITVLILCITNVSHFLILCWIGEHFTLPAFWWYSTIWYQKLACTKCFVCYHLISSLSWYDEIKYNRRTYNTSSSLLPVYTSLSFRDHNIRCHCHTKSSCCRLTLTFLWSYG